MIRYKRKFDCDNSISKGIKWLNKNGFYTIGSCSGLEIDHIDQERDRMYIEFEGLSRMRFNQVRLVARETGFKIIDRKKKLRVETDKSDPMKVLIFENLIAGLKKDNGLLNVRTMGISNWIKDTQKKKLFSVQFYDYDLNDNLIVPKHHLERILEIFPLDCILYKTKHGIQFISFAIRMGLRYTKSRAIETSKDLLKQDYWSEGKDLTLRVSQKWKLKRFGNREIISKKPDFYALLKSPDKNIISKKHLEFYHKYMNLPDEVFELYQDCDQREYEIKLYHYKTRD